MGDRDESEAQVMLRQAAQAAGRTRAASRWYSRYLLLVGLLAFVLIVAVEVFFPSGLARVAAATGWAVAMLLAGWWGASHDVFPERANRRLIVAGAVWFGSYLLVLGPIVRWQAGTSLLWWSLAALVLASPFVAGAWLVRRRA